MFTGIIENLGTVVSLKGGTLQVESPFTSELKIGDSVAHDGVCLTIIKKEEDRYTVELIPETFARSHFKNVEAGYKVNLERPLQMGGRLDGHIVQGHTDFVTEVISVIEEGNSHIITFALNKEYAAYLIPKGSITINGISLTLIHVTDDTFSVGIIPHTFEITNMQYLKPESLVNIETDIIGKYILKSHKV